MTKTIFDVQGGGKLVPQLVQRLGQPQQQQQPGVQVVSGAGAGQQQTVQVVQSVNASGQVVHQVRWKYIILLPEFRTISNKMGQRINGQMGHVNVHLPIYRPFHV